MSTAESLAQQITNALPEIKRGGTLRMFGEWFGRAWDNSHEITSAMGSGNLLEMRFDESETLCVWDPKDAVISKDEFQIARASRVRWQWFYYGRPQRPENLHTIEYRVSGHSISVSDTTDWYEPEHNPDVTAPAVELVSFPVELLSPQG